MLGHDRQEVVLAGLLSGLAGYIDAVGFLNLGGYFVSFMSGNTTRAGAALAQGSFHDFGLAAGLIGSFVFGVVLGSLVSRYAKDRQRWAVIGCVSGVLFVAAMLHSIPAVAFLAPPAMAVAMGAENAVFERGGEVSIGLTYITGTLVKLGQHLSRLIAGEHNVGWVRYLLLWTGLAVGTVLGAVSYGKIGLASLWIGACLAAVAALTVARLKI
ncbi:YoaK family protein [Antrihabitans stalactiti]|uniref:DUF1275 domain-containing protein n=1 Tax=Antrihabitans stalactiti TaxID=2584121 RepID=A0A848KFI4_9NOCA|nr:YoaK family protein [Antrihabitans stalactiti]NMN95472.1 DUF1275 domain-containing protein [Antrihabitans stalactiti]